MLQGVEVRARCVSCEVRDGRLPIADGKARGYYVSHHDGRQMLVLEHGSGDRIRINGTTEVVIYEIMPGLVKLAIGRSPDDGVH